MESYDLDPPSPMDVIHPITKWISIALVLSSSVTDSSLFECELNFTPYSNTITTFNDAKLEAFRKDNPTAAALPLLKAMTKKQDSIIIMKYFEPNNLQIKLRCLQ